MPMEWRGGSHIVPPDFGNDHLPEDEPMTSPDGALSDEQKYRVVDTEKGGRCMIFRGKEPQFAITKWAADMVADALNAKLAPAPSRVEMPEEPRYYDSDGYPVHQGVNASKPKFVLVSDYDRLRAHATQLAERLAESDARIYGLRDRAEAAESQKSYLRERLNDLLEKELDARNKCADAEKRAGELQIELSGTQKSEETAIIARNVAERAAGAMRERLQRLIVKFLLPLYLYDRAATAKLCDEELDRSGALLGWLREAALAGEEKA